MQFTHGSCNWPYNVDFRIFDFYIRGYSVEECADAITDQYVNCSPEMFFLSQSENKNVSNNNNTTSRKHKSAQVEKKILAALGKDFSAYLASSANGLLMENNNRKNYSSVENAMTTTTNSARKANKTSKINKNRSSKNNINVAAAIFGSILMEASTENNNCNLDNNNDEDDDVENDEARNLLIEEVSEQYTVFRQLELRDEFLHDPRSFLSASVDAVSKSDRREILERFYHLDPLFYRSAFGIPIFASMMKLIHNHQLLASILKGDYYHHHNHHHQPYYQGETAMTMAENFSSPARNQNQNNYDEKFSATNEATTSSSPFSPITEKIDTLLSSLTVTLSGGDISEIQSEYQKNEQQQLLKNNINNNSNVFNPVISRAAKNNDNINDHLPSGNSTKNGMMISSSHLKNNTLMAKHKKSLTAANSAIVAGERNSKYTVSSMHAELQRQTVIGRNFSAVVTPVLMKKFNTVMERLQRECVAKNVSAVIVAPRQSFIDRQSENLIRIALLVFRGYDNGSLLVSASQNLFGLNAASGQNGGDGGDYFSNVIGNIFGNNNNNDGKSAATASDQNSKSSTTNFKNTNSTTIMPSSATTTNNNKNTISKNEITPPQQIEFSAHFSIVDAISEHFQLSPMLAWKYATLIFAAHHRLASAHIFQELVLHSADLMQSLAHLFMTTLCTESMIFVNTELQERGAAVSDAARLFGDARVFVEIVNAARNSKVFFVAVAKAASIPNSSNNSVATVTAGNASVVSNNSTSQAMIQLNNANKMATSNSTQYALSDFVGSKIQLLHQVLNALSRASHFFCGNYSPSLTASSLQNLSAHAPQNNEEFAKILFTIVSQQQQNSSSGISAAATAVVTSSSENTEQQQQQLREAPSATPNNNNGVTTNNASNIPSSNNTNNNSSNSTTMNFSKNLLEGFLCELEKLFLVDETTTISLPTNNADDETPLKNNNNFNNSFIATPQLQDQEVHHNKIVIVKKKLKSVEKLQDIKNMLKLVKTSISRETQSVHSLALGVAVGGGASFENEHTFEAANKILEVAMVMCTMLQAACF